MTFIPSAVKKLIAINKNGPEIVATPSAMYPGTTKIVVDSTGALNSDIAWQIYSQSGQVPHFTLDVVASVVYQHISLDGSAPIDESSRQAPHKRGRVVWICIAKPTTEAISEEETFWAGQAVREIAEFCGVRTDTFTDFPGVVSSRDKSVTMTLNSWYQFSGIAAAAVIPFVSRFGPGKLDVSAFKRGVENILPRDPVEEDEGDDGEVPAFRGRSISEGSKGKMVEQLQRMLGHKVTGEYGTELAASVLAMKRLLELDDDTTIDASVWNAMIGLIEHNRSGQDEEA